MTHLHSLTEEIVTTIKHKLQRGCRRIGVTVLVRPVNLSEFTRLLSLQFDSEMGVKMLGLVEMERELSRHGVILDIVIPSLYTEEYKHVKRECVPGEILFVDLS